MRHANKFTKNFEARERERTRGASAKKLGDNCEHVRNASDSVDGDQHRMKDLAGAAARNCSRCRSAEQVAIEATARPAEKRSAELVTALRQPQFNLEPRNPERKNWRSTSERTPRDSVWRQLVKPNAKLTSGGKQGIET